MNIVTSHAAGTPPPFVSLDTAARLANVTRRTIQNKLASRQIPRKAVKMEGRHKLVAVSALEAAFGTLKPFHEASSPGDEGRGALREGFHHPPAEVAELRATVAAKDMIITNLQATLDHERKDREHERENWRTALERTQASLLAAQDTPTARALAGATKRPAIDVTADPPPARAAQQTEERHETSRPWWRSVFFAD